MFQNSSADELLVLFNQFHFPVFAVERPAPGAPFRVLCVNKSFGTAAGPDATTADGVSWADFTADGADSVRSRCNTCADARAGVRFEQLLPTPDGPRFWDVSLQHVPLPCKGDRVIGVAFEIRGDAQAGKNQRMHDDIRFFSSLADLQVQNLVSMFEAAQQSDLFCTDNTGRVDRLIGMCRGVQQAVGDIRKALARCENAPRSGEHDAWPQNSAATNGKAPGTLRAMSGTAHQKDKSSRSA
ncbi:PAS domain-containing protein [Roseobacter ponti]|uniref:PAS domain-containing protein n=1 Tax=Roseobacter ponti TaxID=1891787 RepID=A0A858SMS9_9RHOB|nr:PAS domain-containing protein [Roseobacter ponti]QJF49800.1 PAS domain-containing protein [Roseobacter ponti]